jgi:hypothetical protein
MNLQQRAGAFNQRYSRQITARDISEIYHGQGVSLQHYSTTLGPPTPTPAKMEESRNKIELSRNEVKRLKALGYDIFQLDAALFSPDTFNKVTWAPVGEPQKLPYKWSKKKYVAVFAAISE